MDGKEFVKKPLVGPGWSKKLIWQSIRGLRNGIITGVNIRRPYIIQATVMFLLFYHSDKQALGKLKFTVKQMFHHGRNLGLYVLIYKTICSVLRNVGISGGIECWIAGFVGGYYGFGESRGVSGAVNNQIVLYLFARGIEGIIRSGARRGIIPASLDVRSENGFRIFAGFSLALILYLTEYEPSNLRPGFVDTMNFIYYDSNKGPVLPSREYSPFVYLIFLTLFVNFFLLFKSPNPPSVASASIDPSRSPSLFDSFFQFLPSLTLDSILNYVIN